MDLIKKNFETPAHPEDSEERPKTAEEKSKRIVGMVIALLTALGWAPNDMIVRSCVRFFVAFIDS